MVLATREDAQFLSDAVQGDGDPLSVLQEFENTRAGFDETVYFNRDVM